jgi:hypothetical protein
VRRSKEIRAACRRSAFTYNEMHLVAWLGSILELAATKIRKPPNIHSLCWIRARSEPALSRSESHLLAGDFLLGLITWWLDG